MGVVGAVILNQRGEKIKLKANTLSAGPILETFQVNAVIRNCCLGFATAPAYNRISQIQENIQFE